MGQHHECGIMKKGPLRRSGGHDFMSQGHGLLMLEDHGRTQRPDSRFFNENLRSRRGQFTRVRAAHIRSLPGIVPEMLDLQRFAKN